MITEGQPASGVPSSAKKHFSLHSRDGKVHPTVCSLRLFQDTKILRQRFLVPSIASVFKIRSYFFPMLTIIKWEVSERWWPTWPHSITEMNRKASKKASLAKPSIMEKHDPRGLQNRCLSWQEYPVLPWCVRGDYLIKRAQSLRQDNLLSKCHHQLFTRACLPPGVESQQEIPSAFREKWLLSLQPISILLSLAKVCSGILGAIRRGSYFWMKLIKIRTLVLITHSLTRSLKTTKINPKKSWSICLTLILIKLVPQNW